MTTAIMIQNRRNFNTITSMPSVTIPNVTIGCRTIPEIPEKPFVTCYVTAKDRCVARSVSHIESYDNLTSEGNNVAQDTLLFWLIGHYITNMHTWILMTLPCMKQ